MKANRPPWSFRSDYPASGPIRRWLKRSDLIGRMSRLQWENYVNRGRKQLIHKGGKP